MSTAPRTLITVPPRAQVGELITIRALAQHPMENGHRLDERGQHIARDMIHQFHCTFNGVEVFRADLLGGIAANPLILFQMRVTVSGTFQMQWQGDHGYLARAQAQIEVT
ncbi:MAG: thiosulfate oxidation carrier complex protein SoxZ [Alphaproteobacteria bacterium]|nr:thiosulfate oxidation carrier complex protein SoxZ [Alphaproteobacteria bacterium]